MSLVLLEPAAVPAEAPPSGPEEAQLFGTLNDMVSAIMLTGQTSQQELQRTARLHGLSLADVVSGLASLRQRTAPAISYRQPAPPASTRFQVFDPEQAGENLVAELQAAEGGAWNGAELKTEPFKLSAATLHRRRKEHRIIYWRDARHEFHYPKWQFTPAGALLPGIQEVLEQFHSPDEWRVMSYFLGRRQQLGGRRPLDCLRQGEITTVLAHAQLHAEENTW
jgi:hypothetical protein